MTPPFGVAPDGPSLNSIHTLPDVSMAMPLLVCPVGKPVTLYPVDGDIGAPKLESSATVELTAEGE